MSENQINRFDAAAHLPQAWDDLIASPNHFYSREQLQLFESCSNAKPVYGMLGDSDNPDAVMAAQMVEFRGEQMYKYLPDSGWKSQMNGLTRQALKLIRWRLLVVNNILITESKPFGVKENIEEKAAQLNQLAEQLAEQEGANIILFSDWLDKDLEHLGSLEEFGFNRFQTEDEMRVTIREDWESFDDYLSSLSSKYRVRYRKFKKQARELEIRELDEKEIELRSNTIDSLFREVEDHAGFALVSPYENYFSKLKNGLGDRFRLFGIFKGDEMLAFSSFFVHQDKLEAHFIGINYSLNTGLALFPNILYHAIELAIQLKKPSLGFGRTAPEIKSTVGAAPRRMYGFIKHRKPFSNLIVNGFTKILKPAQWEQRHPFKIPS